MVHSLLPKRIQKTDPSHQSVEDFLLNLIIKEQWYEINIANLCTIMNFINKNEDSNPENLNLTRIELTENKGFFENIKNNIQTVLPILSRTINDESLDNILFILNHEKLSLEDKKDYLRIHKNKIPDYSEISSLEMCKLSTELMLIEPTWDNIFCYFQKNNNAITDELIEFINNNVSILKGQICGNDSDDFRRMFEVLFATNALSLYAFNLCIYFDLPFVGISSLKSLDKDRLMILLRNDLLPFEVENTAVLENTPIYSDYLLRYSSEFAKKMNDEYVINSVTAKALLESEKFSDNEKLSIISIIDHQILKSSPALAGMVLDIVYRANKNAFEESRIVDLLLIAEQESIKVRFITHLLPNYQGDDGEIVKLFSVLKDDKYIEITNTQKKPTLDDNDYNYSLLACLENIGFISSFKKDRGKLRVYHKRNQI